MVRLKLMLRSSLISSARMIGAGKPKPSLRKLITSVLRISRKKNGPSKKFLKWAKLLNGLPMMPRPMRKSWNAITMP